MKTALLLSHATKSLTVKACTLDFSTSSHDGWEPVRALYEELEADDDVTLSPDHFLARTDGTRRSCSSAVYRGGTLIGVLFGTQHHVAGVPTGYAVCGDFVGRGALLCRPCDEATVLQSGIEQMMASGIHSLHVRFRPHIPVQPFRLSLKNGAVEHFDKHILGDVLPLKETFESLLASFGRRTRRNIRKHRRMTAEAGCRYVSSMSKEAYAEAVGHLQDKTDFAPTRLRLIRDERLLEFHHGMRVGMATKTGEMISLLCGFVQKGRFHLMTQVNDSAYARFSLSLTLRMHLIEQLIGMGVKEVKFLGGSSLALGHYCGTTEFRSVRVDKAWGVSAPIKMALAKLIRSRTPRGTSFSYSAQTLAGVFLQRLADPNEVHSPPSPIRNLGADLSGMF